MANGLLTANNHNPLKESPALEPPQKQLLVGLPGRNNQSSLVKQLTVTYFFCDRELEVAFFYDFSLNCSV